MTHGSASLRSKLDALHERSEAHRQAAHDAAQAAHEELLAELEAQEPQAPENGAGGPAGARS